MIKEDFLKMKLKKWSKMLRNIKLKMSWLRLRLRLKMDLKTTASK